MASTITTLAELYEEVTRLMDGEDTDISEVSVETLERMVILGQQRIHREIRCRFNEKAFASLTVTSNLATIPSDFKELSIVHFGRQALTPVDEEVIRDYWASTGSQEKYVARAGNSLTFWPPIADGTAVQGRYWFAWPMLTDANMAANLLFQDADDLFIYAALVESAPFFGEDARMPTWQAKYGSIVLDLNRQSHRSTYSAGRLMVRPSAGLCERGMGSRNAGVSESVDVDGLIDT